MKLVALAVLGGCATYVLRGMFAPALGYAGISNAETVALWSVLGASLVSLYLSLLSIKETE